MQPIAPRINAAMLADTLIGEDSSLTGLLGTVIAHSWTVTACDSGR
jgi:hypothetical protein